MSDAHPGELLSALVDGELSPEEEARTRAHLATCESCRRELDAIADVRTTVRNLPAVDPPFGFFERMLSRRSRSRWRQAAGAVTAGAAAAVALAVFATPRAQPVSPAVGDLVQTHAATVSVAGDPVSQLVPAGLSER